MTNQIGPHRPGAVTTLTSRQAPRASLPGSDEPRTEHRRRAGSRRERPQPASDDAPARAGFQARAAQRTGPHPGRGYSRNGPATSNPDPRLDRSGGPGRDRAAERTHRARPAPQTQGTTPLTVVDAAAERTCELHPPNRSSMSGPPRMSSRRSPPPVRCPRAPMALWPRAPMALWPTPTTRSPTQEAGRSRRRPSPRRSRRAGPHREPTREARLRKRDTTDEAVGPCDPGSRDHQEGPHPDYREPSAAGQSDRIQDGSTTADDRVRPRARADATGAVPPPIIL